jgi:two-component system CheB/CheR fusion protein
MEKNCAHEAEDITESQEDVRCYVGVGASAGGVEALQELFHNMPEDTGASFIIVQHLSPDAVSLMDKILQKSSRLPVQLAEEGEVPKPNHIYLNHPGKTLTMKEGRFHLESAHDRNQLYLPINLLFQSLASVSGVHAVAIVLSGSGSDGAIGIGSIKENGGLVIVQKPGEAQYASMPQSAITTGMVDLILDVAQIGNSLKEYLQNPHIQSMHQGEQDHMELAEDYSCILNAISLYSDIDFTIYKTNTIYRRIERRIALNNFHGMGDYLDYLLSTEEERAQLYRDLLIGVTSFFRDEEAFCHLGENVIIPLLKKRKSVRLWSVACSTGEEAYSLAILICECMESTHTSVDVKIFATDVDQNAIAIAQKGIYSESLLDNLNQAMRDKYFEHANGGYLVGEKIRKMIVFAKHNIFRDAPFSKLDLIVCRNMFIYVKPEMQQKALGVFYQLLAEDGYLFLGSSESVGEMDEAYNLLDKKWKIYSKNKGYAQKNVSIYPALDMGGGFSPRQTNRSEHSARTGRRLRSASISEKLLFAMAGPSVLLNEELRVVQVIQGGGQYMRMQDGQFDGGLSSFFSPSLATFINRLLTDSKKVSDGIVERRATGLSDYPEEVLCVKVRFFHLTEGEYYLVQIRSEELAKAESAGNPLDLRELKDSRIQELENALNESNWNLKLAVEESESRNEELQATNEELLASNEELQSTNEEMQSVNEELYTINAEYQNKIVELTTANADFDNLLLNADVGALYVDEKMHIRKITPIMLQHTNLRITDLERPVTQINFLDSYPDFTQDVTDVSRQGKIVEKEITDQNNVIWLVRIRPYFDHTHTSKGVLVSMFDITKRLEAAKFDLKHLTDSVPGGVLRLRFEEFLLIEYANDSFFDLIGYTAEEMRLDLHNRFDQLLHGSDWVELKDEIRQAVSGGGLVKAECRLWQKDGRSRWCSLQAVAFRQERHIEMQCIVTDISLIKDYEEQLKKERDYYNKLYQNVVCGIVQYEIEDNTLRCYNANSEAIQMLGYESMEEFRRQTAQTLPEVTVSEDADYIKRTLLSLKEEGECASFEHRVCTKNQGIRWVTGVAKVVLTPDGKKLIQSTFMDTTARKRALEQVEAERDRYDRLYKVLYNTAVCGIVQVDIRSNKILSINRIALHILDEASETDIERRLFDGNPRDSHRKSLATVGTFMQSLGKVGEQREVRFNLIKRDGAQIIIEGTANWIMEDKESSIIQFTFLDVTERERLKEAQLELAVAIQSNAAKTSFLSKMSHEIRTPMNGIMGMIDITRLNLEDKEKILDCLDKMKLSMQHLQMLVNDVLDMSKIESGKMECREAVFDLRQMLEEVLSEYSFSASKSGVGLTRAISIQHQHVISDPVFLREILGNLLSNAIKFTPSMGMVVLVAEEAPSEEQAAYTFRVRDSGCGISRESQQVIFEAFEQGDGEGSGKLPGTGLGLAICKNLVELLGGTLQVESQLGSGSEFFFTIPMKFAVSEEVPARNGTETKQGADAFKESRILLAEDNDLNAEIAQTLLGSYGFQVERAVNGKEALKCFLRKEEGYYDLILMDIQMPVMDGLTAARKIRESKKPGSLKIPIVAMSANAFQEDVERSLNAGMNAHTTKPIEIEKLVELLSAYL